LTNWKQEEKKTLKNPSKKPTSNNNSFKKLYKREYASGLNKGIYLKRKTTRGKFFNRECKNRCDWNWGRL
jgi:hypothetical protein